jgi:hypothetical protein
MMGGSVIYSGEEETEERMREDDGGTKERAELVEMWLTATLML